MCSVRLETERGSIADVSKLRLWPQNCTVQASRARLQFYPKSARGLAMSSEGYGVRCTSQTS